MKTIGMLGGMSWESTTVYYQLVNREVQRRLKGVHSAKIVMQSFDFDEIAALQTADRWDAIADRLVAAASGLAGAGADFLMICCNTQHLVAERLERDASLPLLHIADPLGQAIAAKGIGRAGLIGTRYTMEKGGIVADRLQEKFGVQILTPEAEDRAEVHRIIFDELTRGQFLDASRAAVGAVMQRLAARGAEGVILGCTELPMLAKPEDVAVPLFDTTALHALAAVDMALA
ncbi:MAG TPA: aspartate/glutamate racemase family protein [Rhizomicrobium sp.]|nr:aspartate/glutamate racemase family protein [Rhizomicrobium sp.]